MLDQNPLRDRGWQRLILYGSADCDPTHRTTTRANTLSASTCSILSLQKGGALLQRRTHHKENPKHYRIVNTRRTIDDAVCLLHDFLPRQAYSIFYRKDNKPSEMERR